MNVASQRATRRRKNKAAMTSGQLIRRARKTQHRPQSWLGIQIGYSQPEISRLEGDEVDVLPKTVARIAQVLGSAALLNGYCNICPVAEMRRLMKVTVTFAKETPPPEAA